MSELPAGQVTVADLYREMITMRNLVGEVVVGMRLAEERHANDTAIHADQEKRIRRLEQGWLKVAGAAAAVSVLVSLVTAWLAIRVR